VKAVVGGWCCIGPSCPHMPVGVVVYILYYYFFDYALAAN